MGANEKLKARYRAVELQRKKIEERARRNRANAADAELIRATLHRVGAVDTWERERFGQAAESIRADAVKRRAGHFRSLQALVEQLRGRGLTFAQIAELVGVDVRVIQGTPLFGERRQHRMRDIARDKSGDEHREQYGAVPDGDVDKILQLIQVSD
jgi:hypothetical protein